MKKSSEFFGAPAPIVSDDMNLRGTHYVLNNGEAIAKVMAEDLDVSQPVAGRVMTALAQDKLIVFDDFITNGRQGRPLQRYMVTDLLPERIGEFNDYQYNYASIILDMDRDKIDIRATMMFAAARGIAISSTKNSLASLSEHTRLHPETIRHIAVRSFYLAHDPIFNFNIK